MICFENGLDPDNTLPEDIQLFETDKDGNYAVTKELNRSVGWVRQVYKRKQADDYVKKKELEKNG